MTEQASNIEQLLHEGPSLDWYYVTYLKNRFHVGVSDNFKEFGDVGKHYLEWLHHTGNLSFINPLKLIKRSIVILTTSIIVRKVTGFSPGEIATKGRLLERYFNEKGSIPPEFQEVNTISR